MNDETRGINTGSLVWGLTLIGVGVLFLLERFDVANLHGVIRSYWPLFIILLGVSKVFGRRTVWSGLWLIGLGAWMQVSTLHLWGMTFGSSWPLLLIVLGAGIVLRTIFDPFHRSQRLEDPNE